MVASRRGHGWGLAIFSAVAIAIAIRGGCGGKDAGDFDYDIVYPIE